MLYRLLADGVVLFHAAFILFVVVGGFLEIRWRGLIWLHVPCALWGALIEFGGWICPLTPLENGLRASAGEAGYGGGFIQHYVLRAMYPSGLTPGIRWTLGIAVVVINVVAYTLVVRLNG